LSVLAGVVTAAEFPASSAMSVEEGRVYGMGSTMAVMNMAMAAGMVVGPLLGGGIMETTGIAATYYFAGGVLVLGVVTFGFLSARQSARQRTEPDEVVSPN
jgi:MFS family permease